MQFVEKVVPRLEHLTEAAVQPGISADVLRLDLIHPVISGNKWYKLKEYLKDALEKNKKAVVTFGGAYSNHIIATAAACKMYGLQAIGIIRGERPAVLSHTLQQAMELSMQLHFVSRNDYSFKKIPEAVTTQHHHYYIVPEGGYGSPGMRGAKDIAAGIGFHHYTHVLAAVGTGTTLCGLIEASNEHQHVVGISALKNNYALEEQVNKLIAPVRQNRFTILHHYHFGGYAKCKPALIEFMNNWFIRTGIPSDFVYTGKLFYAFHDLCKQNFFPLNSRVLIIHSGGLQGNDSLEKGTLIF